MGKIYLGAVWIYFSFVQHRQFWIGNKSLAPENNFLSTAEFLRCKNITPVGNLDELWLVNMIIVLIEKINQCHSNRMDVGTTLTDACSEPNGGALWRHPLVCELLLRSLEFRILLGFLQMGLEFGGGVLLRARPQRPHLHRQSRCIHTTVFYRILL